jgi:hypothetical protein
MFQLSFPIIPSVEKIHLNSRIVSLGSCFADNIGQMLTDHKFETLINPFGTIYNPVSLGQLLTDDVDEKAWVEWQGVYFHWQSHGELSAMSAHELRAVMADRRRQFQERLANADWLLITLGSAFAYRLKSSGQIVANCHKVPQAEFTKELLTAAEMYVALLDAIRDLVVTNPKLKTIITVSPVRHIRDGLVANNRSKARLIEVAQALSESSNNIIYFPAYEILIDELRDYRFFASDRVHPSQEAVEYIWSRFSETFFDEQTTTFIAEWQHIRRALQHRPFHPQSSAHQHFLRTTIAKLNDLSSQVDVTAEVSLLKSQLD